MDRVTRLEIDDCELDLEGIRLFRRGREVHLERRALDMLCYLAARPARLVSKAELIEEVWQARALSPGVLANAAAKVRRALGQRAGTRAPLETVRGRGYRFHASAPDAASAEAGGTKSAGAAPEPWVGRLRELQRLEKALVRVQAGRGQLQLWVGEAGIGKTATLAQLGRRARELGFHVWQGAAYDGGAAPPYWPWVEVLRESHRDLCSDAWHAHLPSTNSALGRLVPDLCPNAQPSQLDAGAARFRLFDEIAGFLGSVATGRPVLVMLEDLHWADAGSVELLAHAAQVLGKQRVLLAASLREHETQGGEAHTTALSRLARHAHRCVLKGLSTPEIALLLGALHGPVADVEDCAQVLSDRTQGNPLFILQWLELLSHQGTALEASALRELETPAAIRQLISRRLGGLTAGARRALAAAALAGSELDGTLLAKLCDMELPALLDVFEQARVLGLVTPRASRMAHYDFRHALVRETLEEQLEPSETCGLHARLAHLLASRAEVEDPRALGEIAQHALRAAPFDVELCVEHCCRAADAWRQVSGFHAAADLRLRARQRLLQEGGDAMRMGQLSLDAGTDQLHAGDWLGAWDTLTKGAGRLQSLPNAGDLLARFVFRLLDCSEAGVGDEAVVRALLTRTLARVDEGSPGVRAVLLAHRAELAIEEPFSARLAMLDEGARLARSQSEPEPVLEVAHSRVSLRHPTQLQEGMDASRQLRAQLERHAAHAAGARWHVWHFSADLTEYLCALTSGDLARADHLARCAQPVQLGVRPYALDVVAELMLAGRALGDGRLSDAEAHILRLRELGSRVEGGVGNVWLYYSLLLSEARGGLNTLGSLLPAQMPEPTSRNRTGILLSAAWSQVRLGELSVARQTLARVSSADLARMPVQPGDLGVMCHLAEVYTELSEWDAARRLHAQLSPHAANNAVGPALEYHGSVEHYLGLLATGLGEVDEARQRLERAERFNTALGMPLQCARTRSLRESLAGC